MFKVLYYLVPIGPFMYREYREERVTHYLRSNKISKFQKLLPRCGLNALTLGTPTDSAHDKILVAGL